VQGSEARDALLAQIFGCGALLRTGKVQDLGSVDAMTTVLLAAAAKKAFLREVAAEVLLDMLGATNVGSAAVCAFMCRAASTSLTADFASHSMPISAKAWVLILHLVRVT
jgi:DNA polymerase phi